jgi:hypothetical protein
MKLSPGRILAYVLALLSIVCVIMIYVAKSGKSENSAVGYGMIMVYVCFGITVLISLLLAAKGLVNNPKSAVRTIAGLVVLVVLFFIGKAVDGGEVTDVYKAFDIQDSGTSSSIGGVLIATWLVLGGTFALAIVASIRDFIKKI